MAVLHRRLNVPIETCMQLYVDSLVNLFQEDVSKKFSIIKHAHPRVSPANCRRPQLTSCNDTAVTVATPKARSLEGTYGENVGSNVLIATVK